MDIPYVQIHPILQQIYDLEHNEMLCQRVKIEGLAIYDDAKKLQILFLIVDPK